MTERTPQWEDRPLHRWTDEDLVKEYQHVKGELTFEPLDYPPGPVRPGVLIEQELLRRGLLPDREDIVPDRGGPETDIEPPP